MSILSRRAECGAELLDRASPGWANEIDLDRLDIGCPISCVLGQCYGDYKLGVDWLGLRSFYGAARHGFHLGVVFNILATWEKLQAAWIPLIVQRQKAAY